ncbi:MAG TPA: hypothetical protein VJP77_07765, partial [Planctomycetota bacterium]|nr:hypothetical protein [Planctomycetota bacterium]
GFLGLGRVVYAGEHHRRHTGGPRFVKGGVDSPENLLAFRHFRGAADTDAVAPFLHAYAPHVGDWDPDADPELPLADDPGDRGLVGALSYLGEQGVNAVYFLPMNLGGDGRDTAPFGHSATAYARTHYAPARLLQWEAVFRHATARGILLHVVLAETEPANEQWLDGGGFGPERKLYLRELVARFAHHLGLQWNLSEESDFGAAQHKAVAAWLRELDPYDHPITVHTKTDGLSMYNALYGDAAFEASSVQYSPNLAGAHAELVRQQSAAAGRPWSAGLDENNPAGTGLTDTNAVDLRKRVLWDVYLSGGEVEWYCGAHPLPLGGDQNLEDFRTREAMWTAMRHARAFLAPLPIWRMAPADALLAGEAAAFGGGEVFAEPGHVYAVYLP